MTRSYPSCLVQLPPTHTFSSSHKHTLLPFSHFLLLPPPSSPSPRSCQASLHLCLSISLVPSHLSPLGGQAAGLLSRLPPAAAREQWAGRARHQSGWAAGRASAVIGGVGFGEGRLAQEDVEQLEQRRQDHGPQRRLAAVGSGSGRPPGCPRPPATPTHARTSLCGAARRRRRRRSRRRGGLAGVGRHRQSLMPGDAVRCHTKEGRSLHSPASWLKPIFLCLLFVLVFLSYWLATGGHCGASTSPRLGSPVNVQLFNSFHLDATEPQRASALPSLLSAWLSSLLSWPHSPTLNHRWHHSFFFFFFTTSQRVSSRVPLPSCRVLADGCLAANSYESLNKTAQGFEEDREEERRRRGEEEEERKEMDSRNRQESRFPLVVDEAAMPFHCCRYYYYYSNKERDW